LNVLISNGFISNLSITNNPFSPDGDGKKDTTTIKYSISRSGWISVKVFDSTGTLTRTLINDIYINGGQASVMWDGTNDAGRQARRGIYIVQVSYRNNTGGSDSLIKSIGLSNMTIPKLEATLPLMKIKPVACEMELHPCFQQQELFDYLVAHQIAPIGFMPIGSPTRPERDMMPEDVADIQLPEMKAIAAAHGIHPAVVALKWAVQRGQIPIPFSVFENEYVSNLKCTTEDLLTDEEMAVIATLEKNNRLVKGQVFLWEGAGDWHDLWDEEGFIVK
jgi:hypothetical protein